MPVLTVLDRCSNNAGEYSSIFDIVERIASVTFTRARSACGTLVEDVISHRNRIGLLVQNAGHVLVVASTFKQNTSGIVIRSSLPEAIDAVETRAPSRGATIRDNVLAGNDTGIAVHSAVSVAVTDNTVTNCAHSCLVWDLIGIDVCFERNHDPARAEPTSDPPHVQMLFPCERSTV